MTEGLTEAQTCLVRLSASVAARDEGAEQRAMEAAKAVEPLRVEESLLQSYLFLGYPLALNAIARWRTVSGLPGPDSAATDGAVWAARGREVCTRVYGGQYDGLRTNIRALHADMERWMVEEGYGKVLGRPGLDLEDRELCIVALLVVLGVPKQLYSHLRGALNAGASTAAVAEALELAAEFATDDRRRVAFETWDAVRARAGGS